MTGDTSKFDIDAIRKKMQEGMKLHLLPGKGPPLFPEHFKPEEPPKKCNLPNPVPMLMFSVWDEATARYIAVYVKGEKAIKQWQDALARAEEAHPFKQLVIVRRGDNFHIKPLGGDDADPVPDHVLHR